MRRIVVAVVVLVLLLGSAWLTLAWVGEDGAMWAWSPAAGTLRVPTAGIAVMPRWAVARLAARPLVARIDAASREGVKVVASLTVRPPVGTWQLAPGETPEEGLRSGIEGDVRAALSEVPLACLAGSGGCDAPSTEVLAAVVAESLGMTASAVATRLDPDSEATRRYLLDQVASSLPAPRRKVVVIALDAVDWELLLPFVDTGLMPNLARLLRVGTWGEMETIVPMLSPLIWTTMVTGVGPDEHGILDFVEKDPETGQIVPVTGRQRRAPAIWNLASALGRTADVVGWWATWPAERIAGTMVSDRLYYTLTQGVSPEVLRGDPPDMVSPPGQTARFVELRDRSLRETDWQTMRFFLDIPEQEYVEALRADRGWEDPVDGTHRVVAATRTYFGSALLLAERQPDLLMVYIEGTDEIGHILAPYVAPPLVDVDPGVAAVYAAAVPRYFQVIDRWIGRLIEACPLSRTAILVLSDHGLKWGSDRPTNLSGTSGPTAPLWHDEHAIYLLAGEGVVPRGRVSQRASVYDVAPTLAALLELPAGLAWRGTPLPGAPLSELAPVDYAQLVPPASYQVESAESPPVDPEYIAKLQSLGYLSASGTSAGEAAAAPPSPRQPTVAPAPAASAAPASVTRGQLNNLGVIKINEKRYEEAESLLRRAIALSPSYAAPHYNQRRLYMETGRYQEADRELWIAVEKGLRDPERSLDRAAADYESLGLEDRAERLLDRAIVRFPDHEPFWVHLMVVKLRLDKCPQGAALGGEAGGRFPDSAPVHAFWGLSAACAGDAATARRALERSLRLNPDQPTLREALEQLSGS